MFTLEELFSEENQKEAIRYFLEKPEERGLDGIPVSEIEECWRLNGTQIMSEIREGNYEPAIVESFEHLSKKGKVRTISKLSKEDRFITRLLAQKLKVYLDPLFMRNSFAYQEGKGILDAVMIARDYMQQGKLYLAEIDLKNYFDNIPLERLMKMLEERISDEAVLTLLRKYMYCKIEKDNRIENKTKGLVQGSSCSPILSNLYLHLLDCRMEEQGLCWMRFADNIYIFESEIQKATEVYNEV